MFCDQCGAQLAPGQLHCSRCGKAVLPSYPLRRNRVREHVRLLGILWIAYSALQVLGAGLMLMAARIFLRGDIHIQNGPSPEFLHLLLPIVSFIAWLLLVKAAAGFVAGWGLLQREQWARVLALVVGFIALLNVPLGTALGIYTLWVLLPSQADADYRTLSAAA